VRVINADGGDRRPGGKSPCRQRCAAGIPVEERPQSGVGWRPVLVELLTACLLTDLVQACVSVARAREAVLAGFLSCNGAQEPLSPGRLAHYTRSWTGSTFAHNESSDGNRDRRSVARDSDHTPCRGRRRSIGRRGTANLSSEEVIGASIGPSRLRLNSPCPGGSRPNSTARMMRAWELS
jgi:hypothetical protein